MNDEYPKHQLARGEYEVREHGIIPLPEACTWEVQKHIGDRRFVPAEEEEGTICLVLNEPRSTIEGFWPVMSFLTPAEALALADQLRLAARTAKEPPR